MPHVTLPISPGGPIVDLGVGVSVSRAQALSLANKPVPRVVRVRGLLDTGASGTCVDPDCLVALGLTPTGQTMMLTPSTGENAHACNQFDVSIVLLHPKLALTLKALPVIESRLAHQGIHVLIGRDVLARCLFVYDGASATFSLAF